MSPTFNRCLFCRTLLAVAWILQAMLIKAQTIATYRVDRNHPQAANATPGTEALPWLTLQHAAGYGFHLPEGIALRTTGRDWQGYDSANNTTEPIPMGMYITGNEQIGPLNQSGSRTILLKEDFNNNENLDRWTLISGGGSVTVADIPNAENKSVKFDDTTVADNVVATRTFDPQNNRLTVEYTFMQPSRNQWYRIQVLNGFTVAMEVMTKEGKIAYREIAGSNNGDRDVIPAAYAENTWYGIRLEVDIAENRYDIYLNGNLQVRGARFQNGVGMLDTVRFTSGRSFTGITYIDNVIVSVP